MQTLHIKIDIKNEAMADYPENALADILRGLSNSIADNGLGAYGKTQIVRDANGNRVGTAKLKGSE